MYIYIYIYIYVYVDSLAAQLYFEPRVTHRVRGMVHNALHSAKGGAVETGCIGLHYVIGCFAT